MSAADPRLLREMSQDRTGLRVLIAVLVVVTLLSAVAFWQSTERIKALGHRADDNLTWMVSQVETEVLRLQTALLPAAHGAHGQVDLDKVTLRLDLLASRLHLLEGPMLQDPEIRSQTLTDLQNELALFFVKADGAAARGEQALRQAIPQLTDDLEELVPLARSAALATVHNVARIEAKHNALLLNIDILGKISFGAVACVLVVLVVRLLRQRNTLHAVVEQLQKTKEDLEQSVERTEAANRAKSDFLASMSHELRTPLNAIIGFSDLMRSKLWGPLGAQQYEEYAEGIHGSGEHLLSLVNELLDLARIEAGHLQVFDEVFDLREEVDAALSLVKPRAVHERIRLYSELPPQGIHLTADRLRVRQILANLLSNGVKFTRAGGSVKVGARVRGDGSLEVEIIDTGCGMAEEDVADALQPFTQLNTNARLAREGTGLGLPLALGMMEAHGGTLSISSRPGYGTVVTLTFPAGRVIGGENHALSTPAQVAQPASDRKCQPVDVS